MLQFGSFDAKVVEPVIILPGESKTLIVLEAFSNRSGLKIISLGVTEHPHSRYTYRIDGRQIVLPVPLGTFNKPVYTCRDLGCYIEAQNRFSITVHNEGADTLRYAAYVVYDQPKHD